MAHCGIDFGTTNSVVSVVDEFGNPKTVPNAEGETHTPTVVSFEDGESPIVGREAENHKLAQPDKTISEFKLSLGSEEVLYKTPKGKTYTAKDLAVVVLRKLKKDTELFLGEPIESVNITVPANFSDAQKNSLKTAAEEAGLTVSQLVHEPTAAAIAYSVNKGLDQKVMVYDLGGGTFDVSIVQCQGSGLQVLGTDGIADLGGRKFTQAIEDFVLKDFVETTGYSPDPAKEPAFFQDLRDRSENAKLALGVKQSTKITIAANGNYYTVELTRDEFNKTIEPLIQPSIEKCESLLEQLGLDWDAIDKVLLVGGGSKVLLVKEAIEQAYGRPVSQDIDGMKAISHGAAIQAAVLAADANGNVVIKGRAVPAPKAEVRDVTAHGIGCTIADPLRDEINAVIIPKHSPIPSEKEDTFRLQTPDQSAASIEILQGDDGKQRSECEVIGEIKLEDLPIDTSLPARILVQYGIDHNGMATARATDILSGKKADMQFDYSKGVNRAAAS